MIIDKYLFTVDKRIKYMAMAFSNHCHIVILYFPECEN